MFRKFSKLIILLVRFIVVICVSLIPKNKNIWVFGAWFGKSFSDNSKYFYLHVAKNDKAICPIWIYKDTGNKKLLDDFDKYNVRAYYYLSVKGIYYQLLARNIFVSHSIFSDLNPWCIGFNTIRYQLWHGIPLKKIGYDDEFHSSKLKKNIIYKLLTNEVYNYILSTGAKATTVLATAFDMPQRKCLSLGYPRNDVFSLKNAPGENSFKVLYMPTYRVDKTELNKVLNPEQAPTLKDINNVLKTNNITLHFRVHPANIPDKNSIQSIIECSNMFLSKEADIYDVINSFDCIITDYSSIVFDFALTGRPIIFFPFDKDKYLKSERGMYYNYNELVYGYPYGESWSEVIKKVVLLKNNNEQFNFASHKLREFHDAALLKNFPKVSFSDNLYLHVKKHTS